MPMFVFHNRDQDYDHYQEAKHGRSLLPDFAGIPRLVSVRIDYSSAFLNSNLLSKANAGDVRPKKPTNTGALSLR